MGSIYKPTPTALKYRIAYVNEHGRRVTTGGFRDRKATVEKLRQLEIRVDRIRAGLPVEGQGKLLTPIADAVEAHTAELRRMGRAAKTVVGASRPVLAIADHAKWQTIGEINPDGLLRFLAHLEGKGMSPRTQNSYREKLAQLVTYCIGRGWLAANPIASVKSAPTAGRQPRKRRAFTPEELELLLATVPPRRRLVYLVASLSGLRRNELRHLEKQDLSPVGPSPRWHLRAGIQKSRRADMVPMLPECAEALAPVWQELPLPTSRVFPGIPICATVNADLIRAGIAKRDHRNRQVDFHALRLSFCTQLAKRLPIQVVQRLMRHSSIQMTCNVYLDLGVEDLEASMTNLPRLMEKPPQKREDVA